MQTHSHWALPVEAYHCNLLFPQLLVLQNTLYNSHLTESKFLENPLCLWLHLTYLPSNGITAKEFSVSSLLPWCTRSLGIKKDNLPKSTDFLGYSTLFKSSFQSNLNAVIAKEENKHSHFYPLISFFFWLQKTAVLTTLTMGTLRHSLSVCFPKTRWCILSLMSFSPTITRWVICCLFSQISECWLFPKVQIWHLSSFSFYFFF